MEKVRYFEVDMSNEEEKGVYSMCIKATDKPTKQEAEKFLAKDMQNMGYTAIDAIYETTLEEAKKNYDMENEANFPILNCSRRKLWARVGISLEITEEEEKVLFCGDTEAGKEVVKKIFADGRFFLDGETYAPSESVADFNDEYDTDYEEIEIGWDIYCKNRP